MSEMPNHPLFDIRPNIRARTVDRYYSHAARCWIDTREVEELDIDYPWRGTYEGLDAIATTRDGVVSMLTRMLERRAG